jgi:FHS family L-fucose permease-like MFS transporter
MFVSESGRNLAFTFSLVASLFCLWGFCNGMIDVMDKHFQEVLHLSLGQSAWVQTAHYLGYCGMAFPAGLVAQRFGYKGGIIAGLLIVALGGFWFLAAVRIAHLLAFLFGVFLIAAGLSCLETVANPYTAVLGDKRNSAVRINLAQSFNGVGWIFGPIAGSLFFYSVDAHGRSTGSERLDIPYVGVAILVLVLAGIFYLAPVPDVRTKDEYRASEDDAGEAPSPWTRPHFAAGVVAQFLYVAAQAGIFSFFINYMTSQVPPIPPSWPAALDRLAAHAGALGSWLSGWFQPAGSGVIGMSDKGAANLAAVAFVWFLAGRGSGAWLLHKLAAHRLLALYGILNVAATLVVVAKWGWASVAAVFCSYFFMSIMFPTIFDLGIHGLGSRTKRASSYLVMAIVGGAFLPKLMGYIADRTDISVSFLLPTACFAFIAYYGLRWPKLSRA